MCLTVAAGYTYAVEYGRECFYGLFILRHTAIRATMA